MGRSRVVCLALGIGLVWCQSLGLNRAETASDGRWPMTDERCSNRAVSCDLQAGSLHIQELLTTYIGATELRDILEQNLAEPRALASGDVDTDGVVDLICGYTGPDGGILVVYRGNLHSIYPHYPGPAGGQRNLESKGPGSHQRVDPLTQLPIYCSPFHPNASVIALPESPDFLGVGDADADGHADLVVAAAGHQALHLLPGDGQGGFGPAHQIPLPGRVFKVMTGEFCPADGLMDVVVGVMGSQGPQMLIFTSPEGALRGQPTTVAMPLSALSLPTSEFGLAIPDFRSGNSALKIGSTESEDVVAELPMRLNADALSDLVLLVRGRSRPLVALTRPSAIFTVNSPSDDGDSNPGDGVCNDGSGRCTLRAAIEQANASLGADLIQFNIPTADVPTIAPTRALPPITDPLTIDGTTQPGGWVELSGAEAGVAADGLTITAGHSVVRGLIINRFDNNGLRLISGGGNVIEGNLIGTDATGMISRGNAFDGIRVDNAPGNTLGGTTPAARNVISGHNLHGIEIAGPQATGNVVQGNYIGTTAAGTAVLGNAFHGVFINNAPNTTVGGVTAGTRNLISGNWDGVRIAGPNATGNRVQGNLIGTNASGTRVLGNAGDGVFINDAPGNLIGGTVASARNVIAGNTAHGVFILGRNATGNQVQGNYIGTNLAGTVALYNGVGVFINDAPGNLIGGMVAGARNVISGNGEGVRIAGNEARGNQVQGNYIGVNAAGLNAVGNTQDGVVLSRAPNNIIGGAVGGAGNVISGNKGRGVFIVGSGATGNVVQGNLIGTNAAGLAAVGNAFHGVFINDVPGNRIAENVISGNGLVGVLILGRGAVRNEVAGNLIGVNVVGTAALGNAVGVLVGESASGNTIGEGNVIAFNRGDGVYIESGTGNAVISNSIFANAELGINLAPGGPTPNDETLGDEDADLGANKLQNSPSLSQVTLSDTTLTIRYAISSQIRHSAYPIRIEFFKADAGGQGRAFLGSDTYTAADRTGMLIKTVTLPLREPLRSGDQIVATATDKDGNTSEFSPLTAVSTASP